jgi:hypothetical protein
MFFAFYRDRVIDVIDGDVPIYVFENNEYNGWPDPEDVHLGIASAWRKILYMVLSK